MDRNDKGQAVGPYKGGRMSGWERGMDNCLSDIDIPSDVLRNAVNVDMLTSGKVRRRRGISQVVADAGARSLFATDTRMLWVAGNNLRTCTQNFVPTTITSSILFGFGYPFSYVELNGDVYFTSQVANGKVNQFGAFESWGIAPPPTGAYGIPNDVDRSNLYQVTCTFVTATGEESAASTATQSANGVEGYFHIANIPVSSDSRVTKVRIYVTDKDGDVFYAALEVANGVTEVDVRGPYGTGKKLMTMNMSLMPLGHLIEYYNGRLYVAAGNILFFTEALRYGMTNLETNFYMFPERITLLKAVDDGLYVSSDITYFLGGDPKFKASGGPAYVDLTPLLPYKAIEGAACDLPNTHDVMWLSERGFVMGSGGGKTTNFTEDHIAMDVATSACIGTIESNGLNNVLAIMRQSAVNPLASDDYAVVEAERIAEIK